MSSLPWSHDSREFGGPPGHKEKREWQKRKKARKDEAKIELGTKKEEAAWAGLKAALEAGSSATNSRFDLVASGAETSIARRTEGLLSAADWKKAREEAQREQEQARKERAEKAAAAEAAVAAAVEAAEAAAAAALAIQEAKAPPPRKGKGKAARKAPALLSFDLEEEGAAPAEMPKVRAANFADTSSNEAGVLPSGGAVVREEDAALEDAPGQPGAPLEETAAAASAVSRGAPVTAAHKGGDTAPIKGAAKAEDNAEAARALRRGLAVMA